MPAEDEATSVADMAKLVACWSGNLYLLTGALSGRVCAKLQSIPSSCRQWHSFSTVWNQVVASTHCEDMNFPGKNVKLVLFMWKRWIGSHFQTFRCRIFFPTNVIIWLVWRVSCLVITCRNKGVSSQELESQWQQKGLGLLTREHPCHDQDGCWILEKRNLWEKKKLYWLIISVINGTYTCSHWFCATQKWTIHFEL